MTNIQKTIASAAATLLIGAGGITVVLNSPKNAAIDNSSAISDIQSTADVALDDINKAVSEGINKIESATSEGVAKIKETSSMGPAPAQVETSSVVPGSKTVELNVQSGDLLFNSVTIDYAGKILEIKVTDSTSGHWKLLSAKDRNRSDLQVSYNKYTMWIYSADKVEDYSKIDLTYAFSGNDPVTVQIDIPGI